MEHHTHRNPWQEPMSSLISHSHHDSQNCSLSCNLEVILQLMCQPRHAALVYSVIFDIEYNVMVNWHLSKQGIRSSLSREPIAASSLHLTKVTCFFFLIWSLSRIWFSIGLRAQAKYTCCIKGKVFGIWLMLTEDGNFAEGYFFLNKNVFHCLFLCSFKARRQTI